MSIAYELMTSISISFLSKSSSIVPKEVIQWRFPKKKRNNSMALWQNSRSAQRGLEDRRIERPIRRHRSPPKSEPQVALVWKKSSSVPSFQHVKIIHLNTNYGLTGRLNWSLVSPQRAVGTTSQQRLDVFVFAAAYRDRLPLFDMRNYGSTAVSILFFSL